MALDYFKDYPDDVLIEAARMGGRNSLYLSESTQAGLRCGGKTGLAMPKAQQELMDQISPKLFGGFKSGGRSQSKSYFQDVFVDGKSFTPNEINWFSGDECDENCTTLDNQYLWGYNIWKGLISPSVLMKSKSKQSRYIRVWRNK